MIEYGDDEPYDPVPVRTREGYNVKVDSYDEDIIYIETSPGVYAKYIQDDECGAVTSILSVSTPTNYVKNHQESYEYRKALNTDSDFDGIINAVENENELNPLDRDSDDDGVMDGAEPDWSGDADADDLINALDPDADDDGITDGTEIGLTQGVATFGEIGGTLTSATYGSGRFNFTPDADPSRTTNPLVKDSDSDGLYDGWDDSNDHDGVKDTGETAGEDPNADGAVEGDLNKNNRWDIGETWTETSATDIDTDDDGINDGYEKNTLQSNPLYWDTDGDNIFDSVERGLTSALKDTDITTGHFVPDADPKFTTNLILVDSDQDGLNDGDEDKNRNGAFDNGTDETNATYSDTDHDGIMDGTEVNGFYMTIMGVYKKIVTDPLTNDTDGDGIIDGDEKVGYPIGPEIGDPIWPSVQTDPSNIDTDGDGLNDGQEARGWEISIFYERSMEVKENRTVYSNPLTPHTDSDGINDLYEFQNGADPYCIDTDGDLLLDSVEICAGNGTQISNPCGIEGTPPKLSKLNTRYTEIKGKFLGMDVCVGWKLEIKIFAEDNAGLSKVTFRIQDMGKKEYKFSTGAKSGWATVNFDVDYCKSLFSGYDLNITAEDVNENMGYKVTHIKSITENLIDFIIGALKALAKIIMELATAAIQWIWNAISIMFNVVFNPIIEAIQNWINRISKELNDVKDRYKMGESYDTTKLMNAIFGNEFLIFLGISVIVFAVTAITIPFTNIGAIGISTLVNFIKPMIISAIVGAVATTALGSMGSLLNGNFELDSLMDIFKQIFADALSVEVPGFSPYVSVITILIVICDVALHLESFNTALDKLFSLNSIKKAFSKWKNPMAQIKGADKAIKNIVYDILGFMISLGALIIAIMGIEGDNMGLATLGLLFACIGMGCSYIGHVNELGFGLYNDVGLVASSAGLIAGFVGVYDCLKK
jgi:hypothetical protein